jgi:hypothetical protein
MTSRSDRVSIAILDLGIKGLDGYSIVKTADGYIGASFNYLPSTPNTSIALFNRGGFNRSQREETSRYSNLSLQFTIRSESSKKGLEIGEIVVDNLHGFSGFADSVHILDCQAEQGEPIPIGQDDSGIHEFTVNFAVTYNI